jgi:hypothetical protein
MQAAGQQRSVTGLWMLSAFGIALLIAGVVLVRSGDGEQGTLLGLRLTARWSYLWFWLAYTAGAWATLLGGRVRALAPRARDFGLAFAAAHLVHIALVVWLYQVAVHPPGTGTLEFFGVAVFFTYLVALLSFRHIAAPLPARAVSVIRTIGVEYIALAFLVDFARNPFGGSLLHALSYGPFLGLGLLAYALRLTALARRHVQRAGIGAEPGA